jgi:hypothetical protein
MESTFDGLHFPEADFWPKTIPDLPVIEAPMVRGNMEVGEETVPQTARWQSLFWQS